MGNVGSLFSFDVCSLSLLVRLSLLISPVTTCWRGGSLLAAESLATGTAAGSLEYVTKAEFAEYGSEALTRKWDGDEDEEESEDMDTQ